MTTHHATFFDGKTAASHAVMLEIHAGYIRGTSTTGAILFQWPLYGLKLISPAEKERQAILTNRDTPQARLHVDRTFFAQIKPHLAKHAKRTSLISTSFPSIALWGVFTLIVIVGLYESMPSFTTLVAKHFPKSWEVALEEYAYKGVVGEKPLCMHPELVQTIDSFSERLLPHTTIPKLTITIVKSDIANAVAIPNNHVILFSGLIENAQSAEEVAGVLAHEMGHAAERHPTKGVINGLSFAILTQLLFGSTTSSIDIGVAGQFFMQMAYSRDMERHADEYALRLMEKASINPHGLADFLEKHGKSSIMDMEFLSYASTHPTTSERVDAITHATDKATIHPAITLSQPWEDIRVLCE